MTTNAFEKLGAAFRALADDFLGSGIKLAPACGEFNTLVGRAAVTVFRAIQRGDLSLPPFNAERVDYLLNEGPRHRVIQLWPQVIAAVRQQRPDIIDALDVTGFRFPLNHTGENIRERLKHAAETGNVFRWDTLPPEKTLLTLLEVSAQACDVLTAMLSEPTPETPDLTWIHVKGVATMADVTRKTVYDWGKTKGVTIHRGMVEPKSLYRYRPDLRDIKPPDWHPDDDEDDID